ncbi:hypothetical protein I6F48_00325 [Pseudoalteromonas sp. SWYJ118]|uniref:hypothetical protein n=1 Tax=Pseudoalteromonas sp. SWYJ118 TaxID=2792062 RepID=UPI0018CDD720|nr:hypothetical protein [Pseudoalteromonas sp. SWYJ118]MBH0074009.1 hypothetical protein [Pseudoalteromonas sp. SWYJ118]
MKIYKIITNRKQYRELFSDLPHTDCPHDFILITSERDVFWEVAFSTMYKPELLLSLLKIDKSLAKLVRHLELEELEDEVLVKAFVDDLTIEHSKDPEFDQAINTLANSLTSLILSKYESDEYEDNALCGIYESEYLEEIKQDALKNELHCYERRPVIL